MKYILLTILVFLSISISGCASTPCATGCIAQNTSTYDGAKELFMTPSYVYRNNSGVSGSDMRLGLYWSDGLPDDNVVLILVPHKDRSAMDSTTINFNINGKYQSFASVTKASIKNLNPSKKAAMHFNPRVISGLGYRYFVVNKSFLNGIVSAEDVRIRVDLENTFIEGIFSHDNNAAAKHKFSNYMERLDSI